MLTLSESVDMSCVNGLTCICADIAGDHEDGGGAGGGQDAGCSGS